jgi:hypothetical protein
MSELFDIAESLSPRLAWVKKYGIQSQHNPDGIFEDPWCVWFPENEDIETPGIPKREDLCGFGKTQDEAFCELAKIYNIRLWNEE